MPLSTIGIIEKRLAVSGSLGEKEALLVMEDKSLPLSRLLALTDRLRKEHSGPGIILCSIVNAKSGACSEDCAFCAQSMYYATGVEEYPLLDAPSLIKAAARAVDQGAGAFSIVTSGPEVSAEREIAVLEEALHGIRELAGSVRRCASLGRVSRQGLERLKQAGLDCFHHNLEAGLNFFPQICTTHTYDERVKTIIQAKSCGLRVCSGGIFGMGENFADRAALALELKELDVDSVALNFIHPVKGTPLEHRACLDSGEALRIIAAFRLVMSDKDIIVCGGRELTLRDLQSMVFRAGANGIMIGSYLTTSGRDPGMDLKMLEDLELEPYK